MLAAQHGVAMAPDVSVGHVLAQMVLWLGVIVVALFGLSKLARRSKGMGRSTAKVPGTKSGRLTVVSRHPVGKGQWIAVVEAEGQRFLVGITGAGFTPLGELRGEIPSDDDDVPATSLESLLAGSAGSAGSAGRAGIVPRAGSEGEGPYTWLERARAATVRR